MKKLLPLLICFLLALSVVTAREDTPGVEPDSLLHGLDVAMEKLRLVFTFSSAKRAALHVKYATERLAEARAMASKGKNELVEKSIAKYHAELEDTETELETAKARGEKLDMVAGQIDKVTKRNIVVLTNLLDKVPETAKKGIQNALDKAQKGRAKALEAIGKSEEKNPWTAKAQPARARVVYIVAGPNGAGKTTFARRFLPEYVECRQFVNADLIAGGLSPFSPGELAIQAGKLLLDQIRSLAKRKVHFGFETTLSGKTYPRLLNELKSGGYRLQLFFLWIPNVRLALSRIRDRVRRGGHSIPGPVVERRFERGIQNLFHLYRSLVDSWVLLDNSGSFPHVIAAEDGEGLNILDRELFDKIQKQAGGSLK